VNSAWTSISPCYHRAVAMHHVGPRPTPARARHPPRPPARGHPTRIQVAKPAGLVVNDDCSRSNRWCGILRELAESNRTAADDHLRRPTRSSAPNWIAAVLTVWPLLRRYGRRLRRLRTIACTTRSSSLLAMVATWKGRRPAPTRLARGPARGASGDHRARQLQARLGVPEGRHEAKRRILPPPSSARLRP